MKNLKIEHEIHLENTKIYQALPFLIKYSKYLRGAKRLIKLGIAAQVNLLFTPIYLVLYIFGYRTLAFNYTRIGHFTQDVDAFLKFQKISKNFKKKNI